MLELAEKIITLSGSRSDIVFRPLPSDDPVRRRPDIALARTTLDWEPMTALDEGLRKTIAYFRQWQPEAVFPTAIERAGTGLACEEPQSSTFLVRARS